MRFYVGLHQESDARHFARCMVSVNRLRDRVSDVAVNEWMLDSGAFSEISQHGCFRTSVKQYAKEVERWSTCGNMVAAVSQDYMCEPAQLAKTGLTVLEHQRLTIERYDELRDAVGSSPYVLPVLQGYWPGEYVRHLEQYGERLSEGQWVGVGSVCKRNVDMEEIERVLRAIKDERPNLRLHGFGVKITALESSIVRELLWSADSMAWSYSARSKAKPLLAALEQEFGRRVKPKEARATLTQRGVALPDGNSWREAKRFANRIEGQTVRRRAFQTVLTDVDGAPFGRRRKRLPAHRRSDRGSEPAA